MTRDEALQVVRRQADALSRRLPDRRDLYRYEVVSSNGHGIHGPQWKRFRDARAHAARVADRGTGVVLGPFEVQRVEYVDHIGGSRRYSMRQRSRWVPWNHKCDHTVRNPDYIWFEPFDPARPGGLVALDEEEQREV